MSTTVSDHLHQRLSAWGNRRIYGYMGEGTIHLLNGL